ncbi:MAG: hypothetical protein K6F33_00855 [Bacteroidales bacterium]|nr:hypothetical protein [Bacteroidales bacterium]
MKTSEYKIVATDKFPFFKEYCNNLYIVSHDCRSSVSVKEQNMQYILNNPSKKEIVVYQIDNGLITSKELKCDYGVYTESDVLFLIELKSPEREYCHALQQIISTIEILIKSKNISVNKLNARIVLRKYPAIPTAKERKLENYIIKNYHCNLKHGNKVLTEILQ